MIYQVFSSTMLRQLKRNLIYQRKTKLTVAFFIFILLASNLSINFEYFNRCYYALFYDYSQKNLNIEKSSFDLKGQQLKLKSECDCGNRFDTVIITKKDQLYEFSRNNDQNIIFKLNEKEFESDILTCDLYRTLRRGKNQKIISLSLYGQGHMFKEALFSLIEQVKKSYKGWTIRVYHDNDKLLDVCHFECEHDNIDFCDVSQLPMGLKMDQSWSASHIHAMMWRFLPIGDSYVDYFMSRDVDSCLLQREIDAVNEWLKSDKLFHIMRDSPEHYAPILG